MCIRDRSTWADTSNENQNSEGSDNSGENNDDSDGEENNEEGESGEGENAEDETKTKLNLLESQVQNILKLEESIKKEIRGLKTELHTQNCLLYTSPSPRDS
eukprot:TRINITY_DN3887_c0_g1_i3.p1 TRINITY_DN3887_c0_g1~~TRINITY_DN3887_c0_g1_i3.p1  ORF type:complete len:102 (+),score=42.73 TRINITY_DN3887_c0_g1_i3:64-369(+)